MLAQARLAGGAGVKIAAVTFATPDYESEVARLCDSANRFGVDLFVYRCDPFDSWNDAVSWKPHFIASCLERFADCDGILWTDADSKFHDHPHYAELEKCDLAWHRFRRTKNHEEEFLTGTMFFRRTPEVSAFVCRWIELVPKHCHSFTPEQDALKSAWSEEWEHRLTYVALGPEWCWIFDDFPEHYGRDRKPHLIHYQASRRKRHGKKAGQI